MAYYYVGYLYKYFSYIIKKREKALKYENHMQ